VSRKRLNAIEQYGVTILLIIEGEPTKEMREEWAGREEISNGKER